MARTTQRKSKPSTASQREKKKETEVKVVYRLQFAICTRCKESLRKWGEGNTNGHTCPPCSQAIRREDMKKRRETKEKRGIFVNAKGVVSVVDLDTFSEYKEIAPVTCHIYRLTSHYGESSPLYECHIDDMALMKYGENDKAERVAGQMCCFDLRSGICGPALFTGCDRTTLFPEEIKRFLL